PKIKPSAYRPLAPSVTCGDSSLPEGAIFRQFLRFHIGFLRIESACCGIPQSKIKDFCQLPLAREPFCARYRFIVRYRAFSGFQSTAWVESTQKPTNSNGGRG